LELEEATRIYKEILKAINYLHTEKCICHRDINPNNLVISKEGDVKLIDFNVAKKFQDDKVMIDKTGFLDYRAPEMVDGGDFGYNQSVDLWSAAACFKFMTSGLNPFSPLPNTSSQEV
jgi:serine/threonine protein kinase